MAPNLRRKFVPPPAMTTIDGAFYAIMTPLFEALEQLGIAHYLSGSVASSAFGIPRATQDVDIVAHIRLPQVAQLFPILQQTGYVDRDDMQHAIRFHRAFNIIPLRGPAKIDVFTPQQSPFAESILDRVRYINVRHDAPRPYPLISAEDVILTKLAWYVEGGQQAQTQWGDILGVVQIQGPHLDLAYLHKWAQLLQLTPLLTKAITAAGLQEAE